MYAEHDAQDDQAGQEVPGTAQDFDYMQAGNESHQAEALAQEYMIKLLHSSSPASYLPMLARMAEAPGFPVAFKVPLQLQRCCSCLCSRAVH